MNAAIRGSSGSAGDKCNIEEELPMLARRFSLVCLLTALFGMGLASVVAQHHESRRSQDFATCPFGRDANCR